MIESILTLLGRPHEGGSKTFFLVAQVCVGLSLVWLILKTMNRSGLADDSKFKQRESDRIKGKGPAGESNQQGRLEHAKLKIKGFSSKLYLIEGIVVDSAPHELLGVSPLASVETIQKAYKEKMKQYHPDRVARPGTSQWHDAQKIAEALNAAREEMLKKALKQ